MAAQQILVSYRRPGSNPSSRNHDTLPVGESSRGNSAASWVRRDECTGEMRSKRRSSRLGWAVGIVKLAGARKITFSTFAETQTSQESRKAVRIRSNMLRKSFGE